MGRGKNQEIDLTVAQPEVGLRPIVIEVGDYEAGPVTEETVATLRKIGASGDVIQIANDLVEPKP